MNDTYLAALSAISGSVIGALATLGTSWVSQRTQERAEHHIRAINRRQQLYEEFMEEASKVYSDALVHELGDLSKLVRLYALMSKLRLFAPAHILGHADEILQHIIQLYRTSEKHFDISQALKNPEDLDLLREFGDACREDLHHRAGGEYTPHKPSSAMAAAAFRTPARHESKQG